MASRRDEKALERQRRRDEKEARRQAKQEAKAASAELRALRRNGAAGYNPVAGDGAGPAHRQALDMSDAAAQALLQEGTVVSKFSAKRSMIRAHIRVDFEAMRLVWLQGRQTKHINVEHIREVRRHEDALKCKVFRNSGDIASVNSDYAFVIIYGTEFKLRQLCLEIPEHEDGAEARLEAFTAWNDGLLRLTAFESPGLYSTDRLISYGIQRGWASMTQNHRRPGLREVKAWLQRVSCKMTNRETKELFTRANRSGRGYLSESEFQLLFWDAVQSLEPEFSFMLHDPKASDEVLAEDVQAFFRKHQGEDVALEECEELCHRYRGPDGRFRLRNFIAYLHGIENSVFSPKHRYSVYQPMDRPLAHYFINTSHNTYLFGNQVKSESSFEAYIKCLEDGCRCVEIDTWDSPRAENPYDQIVVTHGNTFTTKIKFRDVVPAIMEHAFVASPYPVILSIEQHCGLESQARMAEIFIKELGDALVTGPLPECSEPDRDCYPSPEQLKHRIIVKHKKLKDGSEEVACSNNEEDVSDALKSGCVRGEVSGAPLLRPVVHSVSRHTNS